MVCCEKLHELSGRCFCPVLTSYPLYSEAGLLVVRSVDLSLYVDKLSCMQCVVFKYMKNKVTVKCSEVKCSNVDLVCGYIYLYLWKMYWNFLA